MINILLNGCNGRMGQVITRLVKDDKDVSIKGGVDISPDKFNNDYPVYGSLNDVKEDVDVIIDFSNVKGIPTLLSFIEDKKIPTVICTTGLAPGILLSVLRHVLIVLVRMY
jgi:4-hydroxy-tetrahydrodipicolinate reductase